MLSLMLSPTDPDSAATYLQRAGKLIDDIVRECGTPKATVEAGKVDWGAGGWETILQVRPTFSFGPGRLAPRQGVRGRWGRGATATETQHSTINGNQKATRRLMDHGLVCASHISFLRIPRRSLLLFPCAPKRENRRPADALTCRRRLLLCRIRERSHQAAESRRGECGRSKVTREDVDMMHVMSMRPRCDAMLESYSYSYLYRLATPAPFPLCPSLEAFPKTVRQ